MATLGAPGAPASNPCPPARSPSAANLALGGAGSMTGAGAMFIQYGPSPKTQANWGGTVFQVHPGKATRKVRCKSGAVPQL